MKKGVALGILGGTAVGFLISRYLVPPSIDVTIPGTTTRITCEPNGTVTLPGGANVDPNSITAILANILRWR